MSNEMLSEDELRVLFTELGKSSSTGEQPEVITYTQESAEVSEDRAKSSAAEVEIDYQSKTQNLISDLLKYVEESVTKEKEAREKKRQEEEKKRIEYEHTLAVTTVLKKATDYFCKTHPVVITPDASKRVVLSPLFTSFIYEEVSIDSVISVDEIRAIAEQSPEFVLLDDKVDPKESVCLELAINMPNNEQ